MRIQHNIMAMNSYRNYANNTSALSKNLEKLSSGYRINRAGDDAAGLAISEKMRAQITGLETAQKNAKDGISLVQTAEGALTEVHDMLNRMVELADQSANGTYDTTDRMQIQKEINQLQSEIDRIADSTNFNGIQLLDGSLEQGGSKAVEVFGLETSSDAATANSSVTGTAFNIHTSVNAMKNGDQITIAMTDADNTGYSVTLTMKDNKLVDEATGKTYSLTMNNTGDKPNTTDVEMSEILQSAFSNATGGAFKVTLNGGIITAESTEKGANAPAIVAIGATYYTASSDTTKSVDLGKTTLTEAKAEKVKIENADVKKLTANSTSADAQKATFTINGQKFVLAASDSDLKAVKELVGDDVTVVVGANIGAAAGQLAQATGLEIKQSATVNTDIEISTASGEALKLQIGDTSDSYNRLEVSVKDMHASSLGVAGLNVATQDGAAAAVDVIKNAINKVSDVRGTLGATQNRLDHTINNLSVMTENIQDAESTIRDTDVADEMMAYTKNNILVQSAQAMLAQANQVPQGVLQLLQ